MKFFIILFLILILFTGCAGLRNNLIKITEEDQKNAETSKIIAKNLLSTWLINSGFIRGGLGPDRMAGLPLGVIKSMDELDELAKKTDWTDFELGYSLGIRVRFLSDLVIQAIKQYAPEVFKYIPMVF